MNSVLPGLVHRPVVDTGKNISLTLRRKCLPECGLRLAGCFLNSMSELGREGVQRYHLEDSSPCTMDD